jgi:membrane-bound lytic murein transglycosylase D
MDLPSQLAALPHVESSYTPEAYSRMGAVGLWQFTRATGRRFMRVDQVIDERRDPYRATVAAARLLAQNRRSTGSWPLAVTAYNHGASGMRRATRKLGHRDIEKIVREYRSRTFGFASRNFYVEFLAASRIAEDPSLYFGPLVLDSPIDYETQTLSFYASAASLARALGVDSESLKAANPALLSPVWNGAKRVPKGFDLKIPRSLLVQPMDKALASLPPAERFAQQTRDSYHIVRRGETLSSIAQKYRVPIRELENLNNLRNRNRIRVGQKLRLPIEHDAGPKPGRQQAEVFAQARADGLYTVRRGDSLTLIALRLGVDEWELARANGIRNRHRIEVGQLLRLPGPPDSLPAPRANSETPLVAPVPEPKSATASAPAESDPEGDLGLEPPLEPPKLLADPSDYLVRSDDTIKVQFGETLGHYAEWLDLRAQHLRVLNGLSFGEALPIHSRLRLEFSRIPQSLFEKQRIDFQRGVQENYFSEREIIGTITHKLKRGESIWILAHRRFKVPLWLLQQYNPDLDFETAPAGSEIIAPVLRKHGPPGAP